MAGYLRGYDYEPEKNLMNFRGRPLQPAYYRITCIEFRKHNHR